MSHLLLHCLGADGDPQHSTLSLNAFRGWRNRSTGNILTADFGLPSSQSRDHELGPGSCPRTSVERPGLAALLQSSSTKPSPLLHVPEPRHAPIRQPSTRSLSAVTDGSFQKQRSGSSSVEALLRDNRVLRLNVEEEIKAEISKEPESTKDPDTVDPVAVPALVKVQNSDEPKRDVPFPSITTQPVTTPIAHSPPQVQFAPLNGHAANKSVTSSPPSTPKSAGSPPPAQAAPQVKYAVPGPGYTPNRTPTPVKSLTTVVPSPPAGIGESAPVPLPDLNKSTVSTSLSSPIPVIPAPASLYDQTPSPPPIVTHQPVPAEVLKQDHPSAPARTLPSSDVIIPMPRKRSPSPRGIQRSNSPPPLHILPPRFSEVVQQLPEQQEPVSHTPASVPAISSTPVPTPQTTDTKPKPQHLTVDSSIPVEPPVPTPMENLLDLLAVVEQRLAKLNYGAANIAASYNGVSPSFSWSLLGWDVKRSGQAPLEWVAPPHPIFEDIHVERSKGLERMRELDVEVNPPGRLPGTSTVEGMGWERFETAARGRRVTVFYSQGVLPPVTGPELVRRLQLVKRPLESETVLQEAEALKELIGQGSAALFDWENPYNSQAGDLLRVLNREDLFEDFTLSDSLYLLAIGPPPDGMGIRLFLLQVLLGYELYLRLKICDNAASFPGITQQVNATLVVARRWVDNISVEIQDSHLKVYSDVHKEQVSGLISFCELMGWPCTDEVREFASTAYSNHLDGQRVDVHFLDFLFGLMLPGRWYAWKIMCAALYASPSLRRYGTTPYFEAGLVLENVSYWRRRTPLARALGGLKSTKGIAGWVGPCPAIRTVTSAIGDVEAKYVEQEWTGWIRIKALPAEFPNLHAALDERTDDEHELQDRGLRLRDGETPRELLRDLADMTKWMLPPVPPKSKCAPKLKEVRLRLVPLEDGEDATSQQAETSLVFEVEDRVEEEPVPLEQSTLRKSRNGKASGYTTPATPLTSSEILASSDYFEQMQAKFGESGSLRRSFDLERTMMQRRNSESRERPRTPVDGPSSSTSNGKVREHPARPPPTIVEYPLTYNPVIVSAPPCVSGPHLAHAREHERYRRVVDIKDLQNDDLTAPGKMLVINATGGRDAEVLARAWCCSKGRHAVISRGETTCMTCAFTTTENIEVDALILS
jgi:hypothetical protein